MGVCGVKAARRTEDENMPCPGEGEREMEMVS